MSITFHIPMWIFWTLGGIAAVVVLALAVVGFVFLRSVMSSRSWIV